MAGHKVPWTAIALLAIALVALAVRLSTRNTWEHAAVCPSGPAVSGARCVTEQTGTFENVDSPTPAQCSQYGCDDVPADIVFADGARHHFEFGQLVFRPGARFLDGGNRDWSSVLDLSKASHPVIGRFHGRHLVGLVNPTTGATLATDDYPGGGVHGIASLVMWTSPMAAFVAFCVWGIRRIRRQKRLQLNPAQVVGPPKGPSKVPRDWITP